jgi:hypothetical protein
MLDAKGDVDNVAPRDGRHGLPRCHSSPIHYQPHRLDRPSAASTPVLAPPTFLRPVAGEARAQTPPSIADADSPLLPTLPQVLADKAARRTEKLEKREIVATSG